MKRILHSHSGNMFFLILWGCCRVRETKLFACGVVYCFAGGKGTLRCAAHLLLDYVADSRRDGLEIATWSAHGRGQVLRAEFSLTLA
jgi:hypothetical protein